MSEKTFSLRKPNMIGEFKMYAVLIPIIHTPEGTFVLFERRSQKLKFQPGEICFPGGKLEPNESIEDCAVRETIEELKINQSQIKIIGPGDTFISPFNIIIYPFLGELTDYNNSFSTAEVAEMIKIPLDFFRNHQPTTFKSTVTTTPPDDFPYEWITEGKNYPWAKGNYDILFYQYENIIIWGITARILESMITLIKAYHLFES